VKLDFLGLKTLTVIDKAVKLLKARGVELDVQHLSFDDPAVYRLLSSGDTVGIFQLEGSGMRDVLRKMQPSSIEDIIAIVSLYRPGPMDNIPRFIACKRAEEEPDYLHPLIEPILKETYGIIVYQEQVMQIAQVLAGYSLGEADLLRRAMGKKIKSEMDEQKERFVSGAVANGVAAAGRLHLRARREVRRLRLQQVACRLLCGRCLSDRLPQGQSPGRVHRRLDDARHRQYRQAAAVQARGRSARSADRPAVDQRVRS
jgi:DNA polymerase-3 subunit alpha